MTRKKHDLELSVVIPLEDPRGDVVDHLRTWTQDQTLPRDRFQVVLGADGRHPEFERRVADELEAQDEIVSVPDGTLMALYDRAARAARSPVLILTEAHVRAEPECLSVIARAFSEDPDLDVATLTHLQSVTSGISPLSKLWFARQLGAWDRAGWDRLNTTGIAVTGKAYASVGGLDERLGLFAPSLWSANLDERGARVQHFGDAVISHELEDEMGYSLELGGDFARGECIVRREHGPEFCEHYFGPAGLFERRHAYREDVARTMVASLRAAIVESPRDAAWLSRELAARVPASVAGAVPRLRWEKAATRLNRAIAAATFLPERLRWRSYVAAHEGNVRAVQLEELVHENGMAPPPDASAGPLAAEHLDAAVVGVHALESNGAGPFRWTEPVAMIRVARSAVPRLLRLDTGGIRGEPAAYLHGVYVDGRRLPRERIRTTGESLEIELTSGSPNGAAEVGVVLVCRPLVPSRIGGGDRRRLGVPLTRVELCSA